MAVGGIGVPPNEMLGRLRRQYVAEVLCDDGSIKETEVFDDYAQARAWLENRLKRKDGNNDVVTRV